jgi:hypothetical protein
MDKVELKKLLLNSLDKDYDDHNLPEKLENEGVEFKFSDGFGSKVLDKLITGSQKQVELVSYINFAFYRIALSGVAAIIILLISILLKEGSFSFNSLLGLGDNYDESIVYLLTGN